MLPISLGSGGGAPLRILCLGAHSDDIEIGLGGTLLRLLRERECSVHWVVFAASPERTLEARSSAAAFLEHATESATIVKRFRESYFPYVAADIKDFFEELKRTVEPDVIFCHRRDDVHQDHRTIAELCWNSYRNHLVLEYEIPKYEGDLGQPNFFVPLPLAIAERKVALLMEHFPSQAGRSWWCADTFHGLMSVRGVECNAKEGRAEAFYLRKCVL